MAEPPEPAPEAALEIDPYRTRLLELGFVLSELVEAWSAERMSAAETMTHVRRMLPRFLEEF
jgi:RNase P/RNase MRP subunit p30